MHAQTLERGDYVPPEITFHGRVADLTQAETLEVGVQAVRLAGAFAVSVVGGGNTPVTENNPVLPQPSAPGAGGVEQVPTQTGSGPAPGGDTVETLAGTPSTPSGGGGSGGVDTSSPGTTPAGATTDTGSGGRLPLTGIALSGLAAAGAGLALSGATLRHKLRKGLRAPH